MQQLNIQVAQESLRKQLASMNGTAAMDAQVLLAYIFDRPRAWVMAHPEEILNPAQIQSFQHILTRLKTGEPLPYILGEWEFYGLEINISPAVLIPRPETEQLVEHALSWLRANPERRRAADIGTGSGCIAIALAANIPDLKLVAVDISRAALKVARKNISRHHLAERIYPVQLDLLVGIHPLPLERFDLICANLPYIPQETLESLNQLRWEPELALSGGKTGTELIQRLLADVPRVITPGGLLLLEIEASLGTAACRLVQAAIPTAKVQLHRDLAGYDRLVIAHT